MLNHPLVIYKSFNFLSQFSAKSKNGKYDERYTAPGPEAERVRCVSRWIQIWHFFFLNGIQISGHRICSQANNSCTRNSVIILCWKLRNYPNHVWRYFVFTGSRPKLIVGIGYYYLDLLIYRV
jgi:hypothetical protein